MIVKCLSWAKMFCFFSMLFCVFILSCAFEPQATESDDVEQWHNQIFAWSTKIMYNDPSLYLKSGPLTELSLENQNAIAAGIDNSDIQQKSMKLVLEIYKYMFNPRNFTFEDKGGALIAKRDVNKIINDKTLTGCHDYGIVLAATLRSFGIPAIFVDTASVSWAKEVISGNTDIPFQGHIFIEAFIDGKWVVLNSTEASIVTQYDPQNPLLGFYVYRSNRYYVMFKGLDPQDYGIFSNQNLQAAMTYGKEKIAEEGSALSPSPSQKSVGSLIYDLGDGKILILGDREPVESFDHKFGYLFIFKGMMSYNYLTFSDMETHDTVVCFFNTSKTNSPVNKLLLNKFPGIESVVTSIGIHRFVNGNSVALVIVNTSNAELMDDISTFDIQQLQRSK